MLCTVYGAYTFAISHFGQPTNLSVMIITIQGPYTHHISPNSSQRPSLFSSNHEVTTMASVLGAFLSRKEIKLDYLTYQYVCDVCIAFSDGTYQNLHLPINLLLRNLKFLLQSNFSSLCFVALLQSPFFL